MYIDRSSAFAVAYRFEAKRGEKIEIDVEFNSDAPAKLFIDLFRRMESDSHDWVLIASADEEERSLRFEIRRDNLYAIRLQPELLRGGQARISIRKVASLAFPVSGRTSSAILSGFGEPREAGRRQHHGVDVFAPRHTPVLATSKAYVRRVGENDLGGNVIWLWDPERRLHLYFAHLQSQDVMSHQWVRRGQRIGSVGNSGNARTTYPHLHFGIYARGEGPVDPYHYIHQPDAELKPVEADIQSLGLRMRSKIGDVALRTSWGYRPRETLTLGRHVPMTVLAASRRLYRIRVPDGSTGYVFARSLEPVVEAVSRRQATAAVPLQENPDHKAPTMAWIPRGDDFAVLGSHGDFWLVRTTEGMTGWVAVAASAGPPLSSP
jgi:hypothetical protein